MRRSWALSPEQKQHARDAVQKLRAMGIPARRSSYDHELWIVDYQGVTYECRQWHLLDLVEKAQQQRATMNHPPETPGPARPGVPVANVPEVPHE